VQRKIDGISSYHREGEEDAPTAAHRFFRGNVRDYCRSDEASRRAGDVRRFVNRCKRVAAHTCCRVEKSADASSNEHGVYVTIVYGLIFTWRLWRISGRTSPDYFANFSILITKHKTNDWRILCIFPMTSFTPFLSAENTHRILDCLFLTHQYSCVNAWKSFVIQLVHYVIL